MMSSPNISSGGSEIYLDMNTLAFKFHPLSLIIMHCNAIESIKPKSLLVLTLLLIFISIYIFNGII